MNFSDWYTDLMDIYRVEDSVDAGLTKSVRTQIASGIKCRVYQSSDPGPSMKRQAAEITQNNKVACDLTVDILAGDELVITRGGVLGHSHDKVKGFAGEPHPFYEPFGAVAPQLAHMEVPVLQMKRI